MQPSWLVFCFCCPPEQQRKALLRLGEVVAKGGRLLFSAPVEPGEWTDLLTGRPSVSLGFHLYVRAMQKAGFELVKSAKDRGGSHYYSALRV